MNENDIDQLANWAEPILKSMEAKERKVLMRSIATKVRKSNMERMKRQEEPDGSAWEQRKSETKKTRVHKSVVCWTLRPDPHKHRFSPFLASNNHAQQSMNRKGTFYDHRLCPR